MSEFFPYKNPAGHKAGLYLSQNGSEILDIEKISDNQIRCTLNREDLNSRELNLSELAYGSEKARSLFQEMIQTAYEQCGFEVNDMPLMVEAIPLTGEKIILIITKIDDPDELDSRFSKFAPSQAFPDGTGGFGKSDREPPEGADDILDIFNMLLENRKNQQSKTKQSTEVVQEHDLLQPEAIKDSVDRVNLVRIYSFKNLEDITRAAAVLSDTYFGLNTLYRSPDGTFFLVINKSSHSPEEFNRVCNILLEYGRRVKSAYVTDAYYEEHYEKFIADVALQRLALI